jgi:hypothetical protein
VRDWLTKDDWHEKLHFIGLSQRFSKQTAKKNLETGCYKTVLIHNKVYKLFTKTIVLLPIGPKAKLNTKKIGKT